MKDDKLFKYGGEDSRNSHYNSGLQQNRDYGTFAIMGPGPGR